VLPEFVIAAVCSSVLGWGAFTFKRTEEARAVAETALQKIDSVELKVAEDYITKHDFEGAMNRLFDSMSEIKKDVKYLSERMDFHVNDQAVELRRLREQQDRRWR
jgi:hypothetical protein